MTPKWLCTCFYEKYATKQFASIEKAVTENRSGDISLIPYRQLKQAKYHVPLQPP
jgi:hypothetical protein